MASSYHHYLNCSKAQMCLFKILHIISSIPPSKEEAVFQRNNKGVGIDLNLRFCSITEESRQSETSASSIDQENNNNKNNEGEGEGVGEKSVDTQNQRFEVENNVEFETAPFKGGGNEGGGENNCLDLLVEAARVLSGKDESDSEEEESGLGGELMTRRVSEGRVKKRKQRWVVVDLYGDDVVEEEREPVVRSKRGRNQTLPYRFRDSVVEPLKRHSNRHHTASPITNAPKRRLLR